MTGEKKSSDLATRLNVKGGKKLLSKTSKPSSSTISSPPKAAIASSSAKKEGRRNFNDILRRRSGDATVPGRSPTREDVALENDSKVVAEVAVVGTRMADRVAELERALSLAKEEQIALREALEESRTNRQQDRDTPRDLRQARSQSPEDTHEAPPIDTARDSAMHDEDVDHWSDSRSSLKSVETADYRPSSSHSHDLLRQNYDLRCKLAHFQDQLPSQDTAQHNDLARASRNDLDLNDLRSRLHATEKESQERLHQLLSLKSSISSLTRTDAQATDSELADAFDQLANRIREWVISNFRKTKLDIGNLPAETVSMLRSLTPAYESIESTNRLALYQAIVSNALMHVFDEPLALGLSDTGPLVAVRAFAESMKDTGAEYREWRRATLRLIEANEDAVNTLQRGKSEALHRIAADIAHMLFTLTSVNLSPAAQAALMGIVSAAAGFQRTLVLQKARYQMHFFRSAAGQRTLDFEERRMEPVNDLDSMVDDDEESVSSSRYFLFCVFPCVEKFGDEWGHNVEVSNVLLRARVCCGVG